MTDFQQMVSHCRLTDLLQHGPTFTWTNKQQGNLICKKLDRFLINDAWLTTFPNSYSVFQSGGCSDHLRGRVMISPHPNEKRKKIFKFANILAAQPRFLETVEKHWQQYTPLFISTSALFRFSKKLKELKRDLICLGKDTLGNLTNRTKEAFQILCEKQSDTLLNPSTQAAESEASAYSDWLRLSYLEEGFLKQRAKLHWLKVGDGNNSHFHKMAAIRRMKNAIRELVSDEGIVLTAQEDIKAEAVRYYSTLLNNTPTSYSGCSVPALQGMLSYRCTVEDQQALIKPVSSEEIKETLFLMPLDKSPGPDGYTTEFFKAAWGIIGQDLAASIKSFFQKGFLTKGINSTILALLPKKENASHIKDYRPISCCNVIYKIIAKILANRLKVLLPHVITSNQSAFIQGRLLLENVLLATELVKDYHKDSISSRCAMKIDIAKAFDSVQWDFLLSTLQALDIPEKFVSWIGLCISTASFSVQVNGELAGYFGSSRGLRQGCPLSPYLFVICMNVLSYMLDDAAQSRTFDYHPKCRNVSLTHLCFADDIMVFCDGKQHSIEGALNVFGKFEKISGLQVSLEKSTMYTAGVSASVLAAIKDSYNIHSGELPVKYLGLPLLSKRMHNNDFKPLVERIKSRLMGWTGRFLSYAGRLELLKSVIASLINFWLSVFKLPNRCIKEINGLCSAFLWSGPDLNNRKAKLAWRDVCKPKKEGGLGLRNVIDSNKVSSLKLVWRLLTAKSLWRDWVEIYLLRHQSFWSSKVSCSNGSWIWKKLLKLRPEAKDMHRMTLGDGNKTWFWYDNWSDLGRFFDLQIPNASIATGIPLTATVHRASTIFRRRHYRQDLLHQMMAVAEASFDRLQPNEEDKDHWKFKDGKFKNRFSSRHTWDLIRQRTPTTDWSAAIWFHNSTPKYSFLTWLAIHNRLSTGDRHIAWTSREQIRCTLCGCILETRNHLFFTCHYSGTIWKAIFGNLIPQKLTYSWDTALHLITLGTTSKVTNFLVRYAFQATIYHIWRERNARKHSNKQSPTGLLIQLIDKNVRNRISSLPSHNCELFIRGLEVWFSTR